jgi:hypothetical protein
MPKSITYGALVLALCVGCHCGRPRETGGASAEPSPTEASKPTANKENRVYDVTSANELLEVQSAYLRQSAAGFDGKFEVRFGATLPPTSWSLAPEAGQPLPSIDLVLIGEGAVVPAPGKLVARSVQIEGLVLTGPAALSSEVEVRTGFTLRDSAVIDGRGQVPASQAPYLAVRAHGVQGEPTPATLNIERSWFVRNWQADQSVHGAALLGLEQDPRDGGFFSEVHIRDCAFIGNVFATELRLSYALDIAIERVLFYNTWPDGVLIGANLTENVSISDSVIVVEDLAHVAEIGPEESPIVLSGTRIYARSYTSKTAIPAALEVDRDAIADRSAIDAKAAELDAAAKMAVAMPPATLRKQLFDALRP